MDLCWRKGTRYHFAEGPGRNAGLPRSPKTIAPPIAAAPGSNLSSTAFAIEGFTKSGICYMPHGFVFRHDDIWGPSEEALVPRERRVIVGHGNASEDMVDGQCGLLCHVLRLDLL